MLENVAGGKTAGCVADEGPDYEGLGYGVGRGKEGGRWWEGDGDDVEDEFERKVRRHGGSGCDVLV